MHGSPPLGKIADISMEIHASWLIILVLLTFSLAISWFPQAPPGYRPAVYWGVGFVAALLLFAAVLLHELAHSFVARACGLGMKSIPLHFWGRLGSGAGTAQPEYGIPGGGCGAADQPGHCGPLLGHRPGPQRRSPPGRRFWLFCPDQWAAGGL